MMFKHKNTVFLQSVFDCEWYVKIVHKKFQQTKITYSRNTFLMIMNLFSLVRILHFSDLHLYLQQIKIYIYLILTDT